MATYRNISFGTVASVADVMQHGADISVRGKPTRELLGRVTRLDRPQERYLFVPKRHNDVFAQFAETMWVLAGRDDIGWLTSYLPRAPDFSDDGITWHGAYGPRLRRWSGGVDQLDEVRRLLSRDSTSRRAVMNLFDPSRDFAERKDIPCNNWLSWIARNGRLHLSVAVRSNDAMWGFSGVNAFEWSILHEMMSCWLGLGIGQASYYATSFHLYDIHFERSRQMATAFHNVSPYDFRIGSALFSTPWDQFDERLRLWFMLEQAIREKPDVPLFQHGRTGDELLDSGLALVHVCWAHKGWGIERLAHELGQLPSADYVVAMFDQLGRVYPSLRELIVQPEIRRFFEACRSGASSVSENGFKDAIKRLHSEKDKAYGGAWKRRGELVSILPNIARKADRLENLVATGAVMLGETVLDTAIDLLVYAEKYRLYLAERLDPGSLLVANAPQPYSDHDANFDALIDVRDFTRQRNSIPEIVEEVVARFDACWRAAEAGCAITVRLGLATELASAAAALTACVAAEDAVATAGLIRMRTAT